MITHRDRAAWLNWRADPTAHRIGASEVAAVLGLSPWVQPWEIWARRCAPHLAPDHRGAELDDGTRWEPRALAVYAQEHLTAHTWMTTRPHESHTCDRVGWEWLHATPDGAIWEIEPNGREAIVGGVEVKTDRTPHATGGVETLYDVEGRPTSSITWTSVWPPDGAEIGDVDTSTPVADWPVPVVYWLQTQTQIVCTRARWVDLYVWFPHYAAMPEARRIRVLPHPRFGGVLEEVAAWRERHLVGGEPPPVTPDDDAGRLALVRWRYPSPRGSRPATDEERRLLRRIAARRRRAKEDARAIAVARVTLAELMGDTGRIFCPDYGSASRGKRGITVTTKE